MSAGVQNKFRFAQFTDYNCKASPYNDVSLVESAEHFEANVLYRPLSLAISRNRDQMSAEIGAANTQTAYEFCHMHRVQIPVNTPHGQLTN
ncbi:hypothetical protein KL943_005230 [Ogataea angusta]|nr:hypothetical protein KL943_005230 [Ogataea angusta]